MTGARAATIHRTFGATGPGNEEDVNLDATFIVFQKNAKVDKSSLFSCQAAWWYDANYPYTLQGAECYCPRCQRYRERRAIFVLSVLVITVAVAFWRC